MVLPRRSRKRRKERSAASDRPSVRAETWRFLRLAFAREPQQACLERACQIVLIDVLQNEERIAVHEFPHSRPSLLQLFTGDIFRHLHRAMIIYAPKIQPYSGEGKRFKSAAAPQL